MPKIPLKDYVSGGGRCCGNCGNAYHDYGYDGYEDHYCQIGFIGKRLSSAQARNVDRFDICALWKRDPEY